MRALRKSFVFFFAALYLYAASANAKVKVHSEPTTHAGDAIARLPRPAPDDLHPRTRRLAAADGAQAPRAASPSAPPPAAASPANARQDRAPADGASPRPLSDAALQRAVASELVLDPLPASHGPDGPRWNNSMAICVTIRNENATDVREWIAYYKWLGVDRIFVTENNSSRPIEGELRDFVDSGYVHYRVDPEPYGQMRVYRWCLENHRADFDWMAFFDADEILVIRQSGLTLKALLDEFKHEAGLAVHWILVGSNGAKNRPAAGGVLRHYSACDPQARSASSKIIANMFYTLGTAKNPHTMAFRDGRTSVNEDKEPFAKNRFGYSENRSVQAKVSRVALYHYILKSEEDFAIKIARGGGGGGHKKWDTFFSKDARMSRKCLDARLLAKYCCPESLYKPPSTSVTR